MLSFASCCRRQSSSESGSKKLRKSKSANGGTFSHHGDPHHHGGHLHDKDYYNRDHIRTDPAGGGEGGQCNVLYSYKMYTSDVTRMSFASSLKNG